MEMKKQKTKLENQKPQTEIMPPSGTVSPQFAAYFGHDTERWNHHLNSMDPTEFFICDEQAGDPRRGRQGMAG